MEISTILFVIALALCWVNIFFQSREIKDWKRLNNMYKDAYNNVYSEYMEMSKNYQLDIKKYGEMCDKQKELLKERKCLQNRCAVWTQGLVCQFCPMDCEVRKSEFKGGDDESGGII